VDVIDLGFGNPDIPSPQIAVDKLAEAAHNSRNHRYSLSRGLPKLREAVAALYERKWGVQLDPETRDHNTIGSKEGFSHLMWVLLEPGDAAIVPSPSYPIHIYGPLFAGADLRQVPMSHPDVDFFEDASRPRLRTSAGPSHGCSSSQLPAQPHRGLRRPRFMQRWSTSAREREMIVVHDFAYADVGFDGYQPPSILQAEGAKECAVEFYSMTKSFSMAGWRAPSWSGNPEVVAGPGQAQELPRLRHVPADPDRRHRHDERGVGLSHRGVQHLREPARRPRRRAWPDRMGHPQSRRVDVRVGADPRAVRREMKLARVLLDDRRECEVACRPVSASALVVTASCASR
jgi:hypothetical protein